MAKKVIVLDENGKQFELTPTRILERDSFGDIYRFVKKTSIRKALKAFAADSNTIANDALLQHTNYDSNYEVTVGRTYYGVAPEILPVHIGCITFVGKNATKIANWAKKVVSKTGTKTVAKVRAAAAGRAKRA